MTSSRMVTNEVRFSYVHLLKPRESSFGGDPKFSVTLLIPKSDLQMKQNLDNAIASAKEYGRTSKWNGVVPPIVAIPLKDGDGTKDDGSAYGEECAGHWILTASANASDRLAIVDTQGQAIIDPNEIYSGMYGRIAINFSAYFAQGKKGIGCYISKNIQKTRDGEAFGGVSASASDDFGTPAVQAQPVYQQTVQAQPVYQQPVYAQQVQPQYAPPAQQQYDPTQQYAQTQAPIYQQQVQDPFAYTGQPIQVSDDDLPF